VPEPFLAEAQDDATALAIRDFERAGLDIFIDDEIPEAVRASVCEAGVGGWSCGDQPG